MSCVQERHCLIHTASISLKHLLKSDSEILYSPSEVVPVD